MVAKKVWIPARGTYSVGESSEPYNPTVGELSNDTSEPRNIDFANCIQGATDTAQRFLEGNTELEEYLKVSSLANLAAVFKDDSGEWKARGDPTEIAIQVLASRFGWNRLKFTAGEAPSWKQVAEFPFDSDVKKMSVIFEEAFTGKHHVFTKGAVERVIASCTAVHTHVGGQSEPVTDEIRENILANMEAIAALGLRVLALASREYPGSFAGSEDLNRDEVEKELVFRGLIGLYDPPRPESAPSVRRCHEAGIAVHMLTGDHPGTARAIALDVGILPSRIKELSKDVVDAMVMTAQQFDKLSDDEVDALPTLPLVIARCAPSTKVRMIKALHRRKKFAGMVSHLTT